MIDYVCVIQPAIKLGVSVTRAFNYSGGEFTDKNASRLLDNKLKGLIKSRQRAQEKWDKNILHIWAKDTNVANTLRNVYEQRLDDAIESDTIVLVTTITSEFNEYAMIFKNEIAD